MSSMCRLILTFILTAVIVGGASIGSTSFVADDLFIPAVGRGPGASGSTWFTTVWFHNPGVEEAVVTVSLLLRGQPNPTPESQVFVVPAGASVTFNDAIVDLFGLTSASGAFRIQSTNPVAVGSRIFNQPGDTISESQGQFMAGVPARFALTPGRSVEVPGILQPADESFRSNFGFIETSGSPAQVEVTLVDGSGIEVASKGYSIGPYAAFQRSIANLAPEVTVEGGVLRFEVVGATGAIIAYASAVANGIQSQDPTTLDMTLDPLILGGITGVEAGPGLVGGGNDGLVVLQVLADDGIEVSTSGVSIADDGITADHIKPGEVMLGAKVGADILTDVVTFEAGANVNVDHLGSTVKISAFGCFGERQERAVTQPLVADSAGSWFAGSDTLDIPAAGRWRLGYHVLVEVHNSGLGTLNHPVNIVLYDATQENFLRTSLSVFGPQVDLNSSVYATVSGEAVIDVDQPSTIKLAARTSNNDLVVTIHPHEVDLSGDLSNPDATSFFFRECLHRDD